MLISTIGLDADDPATGMALEDCASLPAYHHVVKSLDISNAFASIALQINQMRLTQWERCGESAHRSPKHPVADPYPPNFCHGGRVLLSSRARVPVQGG